MAVSSIAFQPYAAHFHLRPSLCQHKLRFRSVDTIYEAQGVAKYSEVSKWKRFTSEELGITQSMISMPAKKVLRALKEKGYRVYLVGGCVRDLTLKLEPQYFHVLTSAEIEEVERTFSSVSLWWKRKRVLSCRVYFVDGHVTVSSFSTDEIRFNMVSRSVPKRPTGSDVNDFIRWKNCLLQDFTIDGLIFDPYANIIYDYIGGMKDIKMAKMRTIISPSICFQEDYARVIRGIKIAASLGFGFTRETTRYLKNLSFLISGPKQRDIRKDVNHMLSFGSAEASLRLLWKFGLLEILLPFQAAYFSQNGFRRCDKRSNMLLSLFSSLDKVLRPTKLCRINIWPGILAFHKALYDKPRDPLVVAAFSLAVHGGGDVSEAVKVAKQISLPYDTSFPELLEPCTLNSKALANEVMDLAVSVEDALRKMTDKSSSDRVPITPRLRKDVSRIFECVGEGVEHGYVAKRDSQINYEALYCGDMAEIRHLFAKIVFDTVFPLNLEE